MNHGTAKEAGLWDRLVNEKFAGEQPVLPDEESLTAARRLYRRGMGRAFKGKVKLVSGNRYTWVRGNTMTVNPDRNERPAGGLRAMIHNLSHYCHATKHPADAPHSARQAYIERDLVDYAIESGFLDGSLARPKAAKPDIVQKRYAAILARRDKWAGKLKKAKTFHAKAAREAAAYEKRHGDRLEANSA